MTADFEQLYQQLVQTRQTIDAGEHQHVREPPARTEVLLRRLRDAIQQIETLLRYAQRNAVPQKYQLRRAHDALEAVAATPALYGVEGDLRIEYVRAGSVELGIGAPGRFSNQVPAGEPPGAPPG